MADEHLLCFVPARRDIISGRWQTKIGRGWNIGAPIWLTRHLREPSHREHAVDRNRAATTPSHIRRHMHMHIPQIVLRSRHSPSTLAKETAPYRHRWAIWMALSYTRTPRIQN
jgi:hypothetical protein